MGKIYAAKTNHITNPAGFYMEQIVFSWKVKECKGKKQKNARILISKEKDFSEILFDTKEAELDSCGTKVNFQTAPYTRYYWKVIVTTDQGEVVESDVQFFETAKQDEPWTGKWITCSWKEGRHPIFSKLVSTEKEVERARLYICGLGLYEAYFTSNKIGKPEKIGKEYLAPYCNNYDQWIQYLTYEVTEQMKAGGELSVLLGDGWYKGRFGFSQPEKKCFFGDAWKLIAEVHVDYVDGSKEVIGTDESWKVTESKISFSNIYDGEKRDDTLPDVPESAALLAEEPKGRLMERLSLPVMVYKEMKPIELIHTPAGEQVFDLGQEITGIFKFHVKEPAGTEILIQTGEVLQDGNFYNGNLRTAKSEYHYISDGTEKEILSFGPFTIHPDYQRKGYGRKLLEHSLEAARKLGFDTIAIWGNPENYACYGFKNCKRYNVCIDKDVYPVALMVKVLDEDALEGKMWKYVESPAHEMDESGFEEFDSSFEQREEGYKYTQELFYIYSRSNVLR